jgi:heme/copper-type cytochrome/quinol oxidase subunit 2
MIHHVMAMAAIAIVVGGEPSLNRMMDSILRLICIGLGVLSFCLCRHHQKMNPKINNNTTDKNNFVVVAWLTLTFHIVMAWSFRREIIYQQQQQQQQRRFVKALVAWIIAWMLQVGVGHWMWEGNQPNVAAHPNDVSYLAMCTSVLIAWSS